MRPSLASWPVFRGFTTFELFMCLTDAVTIRSPFSKILRPKTRGLRSYTYHADLGIKCRWLRAWIIVMGTLPS